jgi:hypothetical protein
MMRGSARAVSSVNSRFKWTILGILLWPRHGKGRNKGDAHHLARVKEGMSYDSLRAATDLSGGLHVVAPDH